MALLPQDPKQQKRLLIGMVPLLLLFGYYQFVHGGRVEEIETMETRLESLEGKNAAARAASQRGGEDMQRRLSLYEANMHQLEQLIPRRDEVPELLRSLTAQAQENGVELIAMTPRGEEPGTFYVRQTYDIGVRGPYHRVGSFLASVGSLPRIITPLALSLTPQGGDVNPNESPPLVAEFVAETYVIPEPVAADTTAPAGGQ